MYPFRTHQRQALDAIDAAQAAGRSRAWVVLPPGAGKTLVGLETARRRGRQTVVLGPNTAIQQQWLAGWEQLGAGAASGTRELHAFFTALTYQALATFDADEEVDEEGGEQTLLDRLHDNGRELVERLKEVDHLTIVLDECHHLLEVWGRLLKGVLDELPNAFVLGLTATPPQALTATQKELVDELFGATLFEASIPAVVREGDLAPFAELAWLTTPTPTENDWLAGQGLRFTELTDQLMHRGFLEWLDQRFARTDVVTWGRLAKDEPELCDAALRMAHAGLLRQPDGARLSERHRPRATADDWVLLVGDWLEHTEQPGLETALRRALPSVGYQLTRRGIRRARSPVDRVLARSESKTRAVPSIVAAEHRNLADRLRMLVLCDHEHATATLPADLQGVLSQQAGSAHLVLEQLLDRTPELNPMLVTGTTVAGDPATLEKLREYAGRPDLSVQGNRLEGPWTSREWVPAVTRFFEEGHCQVLVGTRGLLGEGWDARSITGLVDLTSATTSTSVVQTRGRGLRTDPRWPEKVALTWSVVCVSEQHPKGGNDWDRFVRKHEGFHALDADGDVVSGVAHVDPAFSPYAPPPAATFDATNAAMLVRSEQRGLIREAWRVGEPYQDTVVHTVRITARRTATESTEPQTVVMTGKALAVRDGRPSLWRPHPALVAAGIVLGAVLVLVGVAPAVGAGAGALALLGVQTAVAARRGHRLVTAAARRPSVEQVARAVADGLRAAGLSEKGAEAVTVQIDREGEYRCALTGVPAEVSSTFATALDEVISPMASPRYVVRRWVLDPPDGLDGLKAATGLLRPTGEVWHSVPTALGTTGRRAQAFARAWDHWVGGGPAVYTGSPEGEGVLVTHRGSDPFAATTVLRTHWR